MAHEPQTNEVRRSACLLPGFLTIAAETGLPLRLPGDGRQRRPQPALEPLPLRLRRGAARWGDPASPLR